MAQQTYATHVRWFPLFHFVVTPLLLVILVYQAVRLYQEPDLDRAMIVLTIITIILVNLAARIQSLRAQDRIIRLEERLRYNTLLAPDVAARAAELPTDKIIWLRFASDEELPDLTEKVLDGRLKSEKDVKAAIKNWRGDYLRV